MDQDMLTDITLDHLPDLSEASVSFQIPSSSASADLLLADQTDGFDLLCNAIDGDASFAPLASTHPRGSPLLLSELTPMTEITPRPPPRSRSSTPTHVPPSSAKVAVIQRPLTLGHRSHSPYKHGKTPSRIKPIRRQLESPLVSSERFDKLRAELETLAQADEPSSSVEPAEEGAVAVGCKSPSHADSQLKHGAHGSLPVDEHHLDSLPEEKESSQNAEAPVDQDVAMVTNDNDLDDATDIIAPRSSPKSKRNPRTIAKPSIAASVIPNRSVCPATHVLKKTKRKSSRVQEVQPMLPSSAARQITPPQSIATDPEEQLVPPACMSGGIDFKSENTQITHHGTGRMAERLVSYSQKLISSIGLYRPWPDSSTARTADARVGTQPVADAQSPSPPSPGINDIPGNHEIFRLSEISPHKSPPSPQPHPTANTGASQDGKRVVSPMRLAKKRISTDADLPQEQQYRRSKKGKTALTDADSDRGSSDETISQAQPRPDKGNDDTTRDNKSTLPSVRTKYKPKLRSSSPCKGPTLDAFPYLTCSRRVETVGKSTERKLKTQGGRAGSSLSASTASSRLRQEKRTRRGYGVKSSHVRRPSGPTMSVDRPLGEKKQGATLFVAPPTKPAGFTFRVDARPVAHKTEGRLAASEPGKMHPLHIVPDLKPLRMSHQAAFTFDKEYVVPGMPAEPFFFYTEQRAKEREKFDAMIRRKEEEMQKVREEQRRREAEEEEKAIKELRRKAIPKANEIPEWYADMPKRKGTIV